MALNFPSNPSENDIYQFGLLTYIFKNGKWVSQSRGASQLPWYSNMEQARALWKRLAAEAGLNLVDGSFEEGAVLTGSDDVIWWQAGAAIYGWHLDESKTIAAGSTPTNIGTDWIDKSESALRNDINIVQKRFACVADMVADTSLKVGQLVEWVGYYTGWAATTAGAIGGNRAVIVPAGTGTADGGSYFNLSNGLQAKALFLNSTADIACFGAVCDGVSDDTVFISKAIASGIKLLKSKKTRVVRITDTLSISSDYVTLDFEGGTLLLDDATLIKSHIKLGDGVTQRNGIKVKNITFTRQQRATAGYAIDSDYIGVCEISGNRIYGDNKIWRGIRLYRSTITSILSNYIDNCVSLGIYLLGLSTTGANKTIDTEIRSNRIEGGVIALSTYDFVEGLFCRDNIFFNTSGPCVSIDASTNANGLSSFKLQENDFDTSASSGLYIDKVNNVQITGNWFSNTTGDSLQVKELVDSCLVSDNQFYPSAIAINSYGTNVRIDSNIISGGTTNIAVNPSSNNTRISNNTLSHGQYAINLSTATNTHVVSNSINNMSVGQFAGTGGSGTTIQNNNGDSVVGSSSFIPVTASPFTYTAGRRPEYISIFSGTVSNIQFGGNSLGFATNRSVMLAPNQSITVTYSSPPTMLKNTL